MSGLTLADALRQLPKVELHCHLEGCMRPTTVGDLAARNGISLPLPDGAPVTDLYSYTSLDEFLSVFWVVQSVLSGRDDWSRLAYEAVIDAAASGRVYAEVFVSPTRLIAGGQTLSDILAGVDEGMAAADAESGSTTRIVLDIDRAFGPAAALELIEDLIRVRRSGEAERVIGIGMDSTEIGVDPASFARAYAAAAAAGLRRTGHQGEDTPASAIATVLSVLGVERVDHGLSVLGDPDLVARMARDRIPVTVCPSSNILIANRVATLPEHPFPQMREAGLLVTLNTDDPALTDLTLAGEYAACAEAWQWDFTTMVDVALSGVEATWLDDGDKRALATLVRNEAARLAAGLG